jgi:hypothetical protein
MANLKMKQYDTFILKNDLNPQILFGMTGVILEIYDDKIIEAEFVRNDGTNYTYQGLSTFTINADSIEIITDKPFQVRFFFDYGAGGCLWSNNDKTYQYFGFGPIDKLIYTKIGSISFDTLELINKLDHKNATYINQNNPSGQSLWTQEECDDFNNLVEILLDRLKNEIGRYFIIIDKQPKYKVD